MGVKKSQLATLPPGPAGTGRTIAGPDAPASGTAPPPPLFESFHDPHGWHGFRIQGRTAPIDAQM